MYTCSFQSFKILAGFCSWAGLFESYMVENPRRHIFAWYGFYNFFIIIIIIIIIFFFQFYKLCQQDLRYISFVLDRQDDIFEKLILEVTK